VTIYWLPSNGAIIQCGRRAHAIKAGRTSRVQHLAAPWKERILCRPGESRHAYERWQRKRNFHVCILGKTGAVMDTIHRTTGRLDCKTDVIYSQVLIRGSGVTMWIRDGNALPFVPSTHPCSQWGGPDRWRAPCRVHVCACVILLYSGRHGDQRSPLSTRGQPSVRYTATQGFVFLAHS